MGVFLFIVIAVVVIIVVVKSKKKAEQKREAEIELKNKAEQIGSELTKRGYELTYGDVNSVGDGHYQMYVWLYKGGESLGNLSFGTFGSKSTFGYSVGSNFSMKHVSNKYNIDTFNHVIHLDRAGIIFESKVPCSEPPPEWMVICGQLLRLAGYTISYPEWMGNYPEASKYVNVVFQ
jgi:hypothetical protein